MLMHTREGTTIVTQQEKVKKETRQQMNNLFQRLCSVRSFLLRTRSQNSCSCHPGLAEDAIQPVLPSSRKREYSRLVFTYNKAISIPFSDILALVFLKIIFFTIFAGNISKLEKKAIVYVHHCLCVLQSRPWMFLSAQWRKVNQCKWN